MGVTMLFLKDQVFENLDITELNRWSSEYGANRAPHNQLLGGRVWDACQKYQVKNLLALWSYAATKSAWFSNAPTDIKGQAKWCEVLAAEFARLGDIRLLPLTEDELVIMSLIWTQASNRLDTYAALKKTKPKLPDTPIPPIKVPEKKEEEEKKVEQKPTEPVDKAKEEAKTVDETTMRKRAIGSIAGAIALFLEWIPLPLPIKMVLKAIFYTIASLFK